MKKNRDVIQNRAKDYYENKKELLRERAKNKYRELPENEKDLKRLYQRDRYHNMTAEKNKDQNNIKEITARIKKQQDKIIDFFFLMYKNGTRNLELWRNWYY